MLSLFDEETRVLRASKFKDTAKTLGDLKGLDTDYRSISDKIGKASDCKYDLGKSLAAEAFEQNFR
jgi:hypothetical protein